MRLPVLALACGTALVAAAFAPAHLRGQGRDAEPEPNTLTAAERAQGWRLLFDGHSLAGWRGYRKAGPPAGWAVRDGALTRVASAGDLVTREVYRSFDLRFDWKIAHGGNSGLMYHVSETTAEPYETGPEYQLLDDPNYPDGKSLLTSAGSCFGLYAVPRHLARPAGRWNRSRLRVENGHVTHWLNGVKSAEYSIGSPDWNERVRRSKFGAWPGFARADSGVIDLQDHGFSVAFRNVKLRVLP